MPARAPILDRLKAETTAVHVAIERSVRFLDPTATLDDYRDHLARLYGFYLPLERALAIVCADEPTLAIGERHKAQLLRRDLVALGHDDAHVDALPECDALPPLATLDDALGCLYVVEGATLGGRYVLQRLRLLLGAQLDEPRTAAFLHGYGERTGERWRDFGVALPRLLHEADRVVRSACATFQSLHRWLVAAALPMPLHVEAGRP